jgi:chromosome segregation ATPase
MQLEHEDAQASGHSQDHLQIQLEEAGEVIRELRSALEHSQQRADALDANHRQSQLKLTEEHAHSLALKTQLEQTQQEVQQQQQQICALQIQLAHAEQEIQQRLYLVAELEAQVSVARIQAETIERLAVAERNRADGAEKVVGLLEAGRAASHSNSPSQLDLALQMLEQTAGMACMRAYIWTTCTLICLCR